MKKMFFLMAVLTTCMATAQTRQGYIYDVQLNVDERLRSYIPEKDFDGLTLAKDANGNGIRTKGIYSGEEVNRIVQNMAASLQTLPSVDTVLFKEAQRTPSFKKSANSFGKSLLNEQVLDQKATYYTLDFFPVIDFNKALETNSIEYYDVNVKVNWGGNVGPTIVMNKQTKPAFVKYNIDVEITALDAGKKVIWKKKDTFKDFSASINGSVDKKHFKIENKEHLWLEDIEKSVGIAVKNLVTP